MSSTNNSQKNIEVQPELVEGETGLRQAQPSTGSQYYSRVFSALSADIIEEVKQCP